MGITAFSPARAEQAPGGHLRRIITLAHAAAAAQTATPTGFAPGRDTGSGHTGSGHTGRGDTGADTGRGEGVRGRIASAAAVGTATGREEDVGGAAVGTPVVAGADSGPASGPGRGPDPLALAALPDLDLAVLAGQLETLSRHLDALKVRCAGELAVRTLAGRYRDAGAANPVAMLRDALQVSGAEAARRLALAAAFLPAVDAISQTVAPPVQPVLGAAFLAGHCSVENALTASRAVAEAGHLAAGGRIAAAEVDAVEASLAAMACSESPDFLARCARRILAHLDPDGQDPTEAELLAKEGIQFGAPRRGMVRFEGHLTQLSYEELMAAIGTGTNPRSTAGILAGGAFDGVAVPGQGAPPAWATGSGAGAAASAAGGPPQGASDAPEGMAGAGTWPGGGDTTGSPAHTPPDIHPGAGGSGAPALGGDTTPDAFRGAGTPDTGDPGGPGTGDAAPDAEAVLESADPAGVDPDVARKLLAGQRPRPRLLLHALLDCVRLAARTDTLPDNGGLRPQLFITMTLAELAAGLGTATVAHTGPIPVRQIRTAACDAGIIPAVLGAEGEILDVGRSQRLVPPAIRKALIIRDRGCAFPGCDRPPQWTDAHHIVYWSAGGDTSVENCVLLCTYHHHLIHHTGWEVESVHGIPWFTPPPSIDPLRRRLRSRFHHAGDPPG